MDEALNNLGQLFPSLDKAFLEDVYISSKKDFDKTVDQLLSMGVELTMDKKEQSKVVSPPPTRPISNMPQQYGYPNMNMNTSNSYVAPAPLTNSSNLNHSANMNPAPLIPTPVSPAPNTNPPQFIYNSGYQQQLDMFAVPATPPPINSHMTPSTTSPTPTAPPAVKVNDGQVDSKRNETVKQELALEYQRISEKHQYNLELQKKVEQLQEFTAAEQRKLEEQRASFQEEKRKFTDEISSRFKQLQEETTRQQNEMREQEEQRIARQQEDSEVQRREKEERRSLRVQKRQESEQIQNAAEEENQQRIELLTNRLAESRTICEQMEVENNDLRSFKNNAETEIELLKERVKNLEIQSRNVSEETSAEILSYFSTVVSTLADGIHSVSMKRANRDSERESGEGENGEEREKEDPVKELKRTFFTTVNESLNNKLREIE